MFLRGWRRRALAGSAVAIPLFTAAVFILPAQHAAAADPDFKAEVVHGYNGSNGFGDLPDCGPRNINGRGDGNSATWRVLTTLAPGKSVEVGTQWLVRAHVVGLTANAGNNGPDPLKLRLDVGGPAAGVSIVGIADPGPGEVLHGGDGFTGSVGKLSPFSWEFDENSNPGLFDSGDGADAQIDVTLRATAEGVVTLPRLVVSGYDGTPVAGDFSCSFQLNWAWSVHNITLPTSGPDHARTDASYNPDTVDDANGGAHTIRIPVLANDDDPDVPGGPGDTNQVRVRDWQPLSNLGGTVSCGLPGQKGTTSFASMSTGPCSYTPPQDTGLGVDDKFGYVVRSVSGKERFVTVTVDLRDNTAPVGGDEVFNVLVNTAVGFDVAPTDPQNDAVSCVSEPLVAQPNGTGFINADCSVSWDANASTGDKTFTYRACDNHPLLPSGEHGAIGSTDVTPAPGYAQGSPDDATNTSGSRCSDNVATVKVFGGVQLPPTAGTDNDLVDSGYSGDGVGPYTLAIPVRANDVDLNGVDPSDATWNGVIEVLDGPDPAEGIASVNSDDEVLFTPANGFEGLVHFTYRVCEDPAQQTPPLVDDPNTPGNEGLGFCGVGVVNLLVVGNDAPVAADDETVVLSSDEVSDFDVSLNDFDPEGQTLQCVAGDLVAVPDSLVDAATIDAQCRVNITPAAGTHGVTDLDYTLCDVHALLEPTFPADPYGADGRAPGDLANRCVTATVHLTVVAPLVPPAGSPDQGGSEAAPSEAANGGGQLANTGPVSAEQATTLGVLSVLLGCWLLFATRQRRRRAH